MGGCGEAVTVCVGGWGEARRGSGGRVSVSALERGGEGILCMYVDVGRHALSFVCICTCVYTCVYINIHMYDMIVHTYMLTYTRTCKHAHIYLSLYVYNVYISYI